MNTIRNLALALALALTAGLPAALAQDAPAPKPADAAPAADTVQPEAKAMLEAFRAACSKISDVSYRAVMKADDMGGDEGGTAHLTFTIDSEALGIPVKKFHFKLVGDNNQPTAEWAGNGAQIQKVDFEAKKLLTMKAGDTPTLPPPEIFGFLPNWLFESNPMMPQMTLSAAKILPDDKAGGVQCNVLETTEYMDLPDMDMGGEDEDAEAAPKADEPKRITVKSTRWIGIEDKGLRKITLEYIFPKMEGMPEEPATMESEYFDFKFNQKPADDTFVLPTPEGFTAEEADAAALGLDAMGGGDEAPELKVAAGDDAPAFTLKDTAGTEVTLASLKGRVVLLDFWATWCGPCKAAMPSIQKIHEHFKDKPVSIIGVNTWEEKPTAAADYMKKKGFTYGCLLKGDDLATAYGISGIPTLVLIDANGKVLDISVGFDPAEEDALIKKIEAQLQAK